MNLFLENNIFEFDSELFKQIIGTAMGSKPAPHYANIFLSTKIDNIIWEIAAEFQDGKHFTLKLLKRFLDDIFFIFIGGTKTLHNFFEKINNIHPNMKFVMHHTTPESELIQQQCQCQPIESVPFLDTACSIEEGKVFFIYIESLLTEISFYFQTVAIQTVAKRIFLSPSLCA